MENKLTQMCRFELMPVENEKWENLSKKLRFAQQHSVKALNQRITELYLIELDRWKFKEVNGRFPAKEDEINPTSYSRFHAEYSELSTEVLDQLIQVAKQRWSTDKFEVLTRQKSLPTFKKNYPLSVRATGVILSRQENDSRAKDEYLVTLKLLWKTEKCQNTWPTMFDSPTVSFILRTHKISDGERTILERLCDETYKLGSCQVYFNESKKKWLFRIAYSFENKIDNELDPETRVGVDLGIAVPVCCALNNSFKRLALVNDAWVIQRFARQIDARRRAAYAITRKSADRRGGHGHKHKIKPVKKFQDLIKNFRATMNHRMSKAVVDFALENKAGVIVMEDLTGIGELSKFLKDWPQFDLRQKIKYKANRAGIRFEKIEPAHTSQRCSSCGHISRDNRPKTPNQSKFECVKCRQSFNADYNAARNISFKDIRDLIDTTKSATCDTSKDSSPLQTMLF